MPEQVKVNRPHQQDKSPSTSNQARQIPKMNGVHQKSGSDPETLLQRAMISCQPLTHADVMRLQRTIGNRAVGQLMQDNGFMNSEPSHPNESDLGNGTGGGLRAVGHSVGQKKSNVNKGFGVINKYPESTAQRKLQLATKEESGIIQAYTMHKLGKLSEDENIILRGNQSLYATSLKITESNKLLENAGPHGSMIKLTQKGGGKTTASLPGKVFFKIRPELNRSAYFARLKTTPYTFHKELIQQNENKKMKIWADCRRASEAVTGSSPSIGRYDRKVRVGLNPNFGYKQ